MTDKEKAKAYDEVLALAKRLISNNCTEVEKLCLKCVFPELKESEDEKTRKSLVEFLTEIKDISESGRTSWAVRKEDAEMCKSFIDYLEKQKEQSITANDLDEEIHRFFDDCIEVHDAKIYGVDERVITVDCYEITARHFAKWGEKQKEQKPAGATINGEPIPTENHSVDIPLTEWSEEDEQRIAEIEFAVMQMNTKRVDTKDKCLAWLKSLRPQQKVEWCDEDADMLNCCISSIEEAKENRYAYKETDGDTSYDREIDWLKSLRPSWKPSEKDEKYPEDKSFEEEWKEYYNNSLIARLPMNKREVARHFYWFAKKQSWKPSKEQIGALNYAYCELFKREDVGHNILGPLQELVDNLKKLM